MTTPASPEIAAHQRLSAASVWQSLQPALGFLEPVYLLGTRIKSGLDAVQVRRGRWPLRLPKPVISVGNIVAGGTGKTPMVEALAREWLRRGGRPAILSRGYRAGPEGNDEYRVLKRRLPGVPHVQDRRRARGGARVLAEHPDVDLFLLDDGFTHRQLHRDLDLVLIDATSPFDNGHLIPRGRLREPWRALARADAFVLTRAEEASPHKLVILRAFLSERFPSTPLLSVASRFEGVRHADGRHGDLEVRDGERWGAFAGIGNPTGFYRSLRRLGVDVVATKSFVDHHHYGPRDLESIASWAREERLDALVCTEKDGVKLEELSGFAELEPPVRQLRFVFDLGSRTPFDLFPASRPPL